MAGNIGLDFNSLGIVKVDGAGSTWDTKIDMLSSGWIAVGANATGVLKITNGGTVLGSYVEIRRGILSVDGVGSSLIVTGNTLTGSPGHLRVYTNGMLSITGGGTVTTDYLYGDLVFIDVGHGSSLVVGGGTGIISDMCGIVASAGVPAGNTYTPVSARDGHFVGIGGTLASDCSSQFTVSPVVEGTAGSPVSIDLASEQRVLVGDDPTGWNMGASFLHKTSSSTLSFTGTVESGGTLSGLLQPGETVLSGWELSADGAYAAGEPMYLSFDVGHAQLLDELQLWSLDGDGWTNLDAYDLTYDRTYASWTATAMGTYAVTGKLVLDGDANRDGSTNGTDLNAVLSNYNAGGNATWAMGDFNGDGSVNGSDLNAVLSNYNQSLPSAATAVPEPAGSVLADGPGTGWACFVDASQTHVVKGIHPRNGGNAERCGQCVPTQSMGTR